MKEGLGKYFLIGLGLALLAFIFWYFRIIIGYILIAAVLSLIGKPVVDLLSKIRYKRLRIPTAISALLTVILLWGLFFLFFRLLIPIVASQASSLSNIDVETAVLNLEEPLRKLEQVFQELNLEGFRDMTMLDFVKDKLAEFLNLDLISNLFSNLATILGNIFIAAFSISFITFFFLKDNELFVEGVIVFVPEKHEEATRKVISSIKYLLTRYFAGILFQITCIIILITLGLWIVGISFQTAVVIGLMVGIFNVIPYVGPLIGIILGLTMGIVTHLEMNLYAEVLPLLGFMLLVFIVVQIIDNVLFQPLIYASSVLAHPLEIFLVLLIAGSVGGILGMFLAIPTYTVIRVIAKEFFNNFKLVKRLTEKI
jgi:predicted PurR-regulated permease PerM